MLHYLNRLGERIDAAHWRQLLRLRSYCELLVSRRRGELVLTDWIGVAADWESPPGLFLVQRFKVRKRGNSSDEERELLASEWHATERAALLAHERMARGV